MGNEQSVLTQYDIEHVQQYVNGQFSQAEIAALYKRFCALDRKQKGFISADEFMAIPEFALNPVAQRLLQSLEGVNFKDFVGWLAAFSRKATPEQRAKFIFNVYDTDGDGKVSTSDIVSVLKDLTGSYLDDKQREEIVARALQESGRSSDSTLTLADFCQILGNEIPLGVEVPVEDA